MFLKILVTVLLVVVAWMVMTRLVGPARPRRARPPARPERTASAEKLVKCAGCGIYLPASQSCNCTDRA